MWYLPEPINDLDLINAVYTGTQTAMHTEDLIIDDDAQGKEVKHVGEVMPDIGVTIFAVTLGIESVRLGDTARFMIATNQMDALGIPEFEADEE